MLLTPSQISAYKLVLSTRSKLPLALLTDGITESASPDGIEWEAKGALDYLVAHRNWPAHQLLEGLYQEALRYSCHEPQNDDLTSVIVKVGPAGLGEN
jgi:serine phosphatase RsbU (regulator of sigma subunit)